MQDKKFFIIIALITLGILFGGIMLAGNSSSAPDITSTQYAKADIQKDSFDWGTIPINGGNVIKTFSIKSTGTDPLELFNVKTSCHCTVANVTIGGITSDNFGMSGTSPWVGKVAPGNEAILTVVFDPAFHGPQGTGPVTRFVSVETNDKNNAKITFRLTGNVVK